ncbi:hypothetical protein AVEN_137327-1 [Araneus ventricosus]|uniref:PiggyBac transposable element-derived protein domain-containing protein n=1 Tax=Araneus ventricosus TaxID=182803 RepID=A0A4Y2FMG3_ARAVE|nr:hypothetical protein AVEN_137327-1 [Araneus ventricosus]
MLDEFNDRLNDINTEIEVGDLTAIKGPAQEVRPVIGLELTLSTYDTINYQTTIYVVDRQETERLSSLLESEIAENILSVVSFILNKDPGDETDEDQANDEEAANSASIFKSSWTELIENGQIDLTEHRKYGGGPKHNLPVGSKAGDNFKMLFTNDMCDKFALPLINGNILVSKNGDGSQLKILRNSSAIILIMGIAKLPRITYYLSSNPMLGNDKVKRTMARDRFVDIYRFFHLSDRENEVSPNDPSFYMIQKLDPFMS